MKPEDIERDKAILAAATARPWIAVQPRSQEGGPQIAAFGPSVAGPGGFPAATSVRMAGPKPQTDKEFADVVQAEARMTWGQHEADAAAAVHAVNRLPEYIAKAEEMMRRIKAAEEETAYELATCDEETAYPEGMKRVMAILRGEP